VFHGAWDQFALPAPFSAVAVVLGAPVRAEAEPEELAEAIREANLRAAALLAVPSSHMVPSKSL
jgi:lysophospholipid acyltransferase (LPLAT)-like uncharacterized protein